MPDQRRHRGPHPTDGQLFDSSHVQRLQAGVHDLSWLLTHGYALPSALKLVGDRYQLTERQRIAVRRCSCSDVSRQLRADRNVNASDISGDRLAIDGFNLLTTIEASLSDGIIIRGRDGCLRDMASMHGTYRYVEETVPAIKLIGGVLSGFRVESVHWILDRPVSNSGRLSKLIRQVADEQGWAWTTELHNNPDLKLIELKGAIVVSADSVIIENCDRWADVASAVVDTIPDVHIVEMAG